MATCLRLVLLRGILVALLRATIVSSTDQAWCLGEAERAGQADGNGAPIDNDAESSIMYDYIVVGAGAGGGVVASRLAQAGYLTLLLDAGPDYQSPLTDVPAFWPYSTEEPQIEWAFRSRNSPDPGRDNVLYPRASMIGGSTMHNAMISLYPFPNFWDGLRELTGDEEFSEEKMRERFIRLENNEYCFKGAEGHGFDGYISTSSTDLRLVTDFNFLDIQIIAIASGFALSHLPHNPFLVFLGNIFNFPYCLPFIFDVNAPGFQDKEGAHIGPLSTSPSNGHIRSSVYDLITQTRSTSSLIVKPDHFVRKILIKDGTAYGVDVQKGKALYGASTGTRIEGRRESFFARKEVIISGGTFNTPQILMLSGVGPSEQLQNFSIPVKVDLPGVGANLIDKLEATQTFETTKEWRIYQQGCTFSDPSPEEDPCYVQFNNGEFPSVYTTSGTIISLQRKSDRKLEYPDLYYQVSPFNFIGYVDGWVEDGYSRQDALTVNINTPLVGPSKGTVKLRSADPFEVVDIDFNGYDDEDLDRVTHAVIKVQEFAKSMKKLGFLKGPLFPDESVDTFEEYKTWVRSNGWGHHPLGTAKMGADDDPSAVVNGQFQVRGVSNLRVVDASIFPEQPGFFPTIPIYMVGEKAAEDIIKADLTISYETFDC
ncbi:Choline dehydrogenase [Seminavis robusta]|uniref:Choline dehydrogenase n=1 Tax=Seminavis robusta TaxID=568900 RepID=A0A9N8DHX9_9STRA|nr:Choline dehydrogenase [Seminavis robusta]|eukprot:Sro167_g074540.1 Choline dehydrogenase (653) ;mRNA; r:67302-69690